MPRPPHLITGGGLNRDLIYYPTWYDETIAFLNDRAYTEYNIIMLAWCRSLEVDDLILTTQKLKSEYLNQWKI